MSLCDANIIMRDNCVSCNVGRGANIEEQVFTVDSPDLYFSGYIYISFFLQLYVKGALT